MLLLVQEGVTRATETVLEACRVSMPPAEFDTTALFCPETALAELLCVVLFVVLVVCRLTSGTEIWVTDVVLLETKASLLSGTTAAQTDGVLAVTVVTDVAILPALALLNITSACVKLAELLFCGLE